MNNVQHQLHDKPHAEHADQRPNADRAAKQPADENHNGEHADLHYADRHFRHALSEADQEHVARAAALRAAHIAPLSDRHEQKAKEHDRNPGEDSLI